MKIIEGNILDITNGVIVHQVNCQGKMGSGLAAAIRKKYPKVYEDYQYIYKRFGLIPIGDTLTTAVADSLWVASLAAQEFYGREKGKVYTNYNALNICLKKLKYFVLYCDSPPVYFPYKMSCGLAGGDWGIVSEMLEKHFPEGHIVKLP